MGNMSNASRFPIDAASILRDYGASSLVADTDMAVRKLTDGPDWYDPKNVRDGLLYVVGEVEEATGALSIDIYTASSAAKANPTLWGSFPVAQGDKFELPFDPISALKRDPDATHWYVKVNLTTSASVFIMVGQKPPV